MYSPLRMPPLPPLSPTQDTPPPSHTPHATPPSSQCNHPPQMRPHLPGTPKVNINQCRADLLPNLVSDTEGQLYYYCYLPSTNRYWSHNLRSMSGTQYHLPSLVTNLHLSEWPPPPMYSPFRMPPPPLCFFTHPGWPSCPHSPRMSVQWGPGTLMFSPSPPSWWSPEPPMSPLIRMIPHIYFLPR